MSGIRSFIRNELKTEPTELLVSYLEDPFSDRWQNADSDTLEALRQELMPLCRRLGSGTDGRIETAVLDVGEMALHALLRRRG